MSETELGAEGVPAAPAGLTDIPSAARPAAPPTSRDTKAIYGGLLAGVGFGIALVGVTRAVTEAIQQQYNGLGGTVFLVAIIAGPLFGLGLGMMTTALIKDDSAPEGR